MASFSYFYNSDVEIYELIKKYNRNVPHPSHTKGRSQSSSRGTRRSQHGPSNTSSRASIITNSTSPGTPPSSVNSTQSEPAASSSYNITPRPWVQQVRQQARRKTNWAVVVVTMIVFIPVIGMLFSIGVFIPAIEEDFDVPKTVMGWIASIPVAFLAGANPLSSTLAVRFGYRPVIFLGILLVVFGQFIMSASSHVVMIFISYSFCVGVGVNFVYNTCMLLILSYFSIDELQSSVSRACSLASFGFPLGLLIMNPLCAHLVGKYGWRVALRLVAIITMGDFFMVWMVIKPPQVNNLMRKYYVTKNSHTGSAKRFIRRLTDQNFLADPRLWLWLLVIMCLWMTLFFVPIHMVSDMMTSGSGGSEGGLVLMLAGVCELAGRGITATVPTFFQLKTSYFLLPACMFLFVLNGIYGFTGLIDYRSYAVVYGVCAGVTNSSMIVVCKEIFGNKYFHEAWTYSGMVYMISVVTGCTLGGLPFDLTGTYKLVYCVFSGVHAFAFIITLIIIVMEHRRSKREQIPPLEERCEVTAIYQEDLQPPTHEVWVAGKTHQSAPILKHTTQSAGALS